MEKVVKEFLELLKVRSSELYVRRLIQSHPDFPSLLSVSDVLSRLGVEHKVTRLNVDDLKTTPFPYLLPIKAVRGDILLIKNESDLSKYNDRLAAWDGITLIANTDAEVGDRENNTFYNNEFQTSGLLSIISVCFLFFMILGITRSGDIPFALLQVSSFAGLIVSFFLFSKALGKNFATVDALCDSGANSGCDRILQSDANVFGLNFSELSVSYFLFQFLLIEFSQLSQPLFEPIGSVLAILSCLTFPIILFSIYFQGFVVKAWCKMCLLIDFVLLVHTLVFAYLFYDKVSFSFRVPWGIATIMALIFLVVLSGVLLIKKFVERNEMLEHIGGKGNRVKHNPFVFVSYLKNQRSVSGMRFENDFLLGDANAPLKIIMVSNLYCNPCKKKHAVVDQLIKMYPGKVSVSFRFKESGFDLLHKTESVRYLLNYWAKHVQSIETDSKRILHLLHEWYEIWDLGVFAKKFPTDVKDSTPEMQHYRWTNENAIRHTPTFFVNGYEMPREYEIDDLLAMTPSLVEVITNASFGKELEEDYALQNI